MLLTNEYKRYQRSLVQFKMRNNNFRFANRRTNKKPSLYSLFQCDTRIYVVNPKEMTTYVTYIKSKKIIILN